MRERKRETERQRKIKCLCERERERERGRQRKRKCVRERERWKEREKKDFERYGERPNIKITFKVTSEKLLFQLIRIEIYELTKDCLAFT